MPTEFEWKIFAGITASRKFKKLMTDLQCVPEHFKGRIISMSMFNDIVWDSKKNKEQCEYNSQEVAEYGRKFPRGHWSFLGAWIRRKGTEQTHKPDGFWDQWKTKFWQISLDPVIRYFVPAFARGDLRSKGGRKKSIHFNGSTENHRVASPYSDF